MDVMELLLKKKAALVIAQREATENPDDLTDEEYFGSDEFYDTSIQLLDELIEEVKREGAK
jgi:hypothetical protein